jgi:hypothetical protein
MSSQGDIEQLEQAIRLLKIQYDQYFAGVLNLPPYELRRDVERLIRQHNNSTFEKSSLRFYFNSLVTRFNTFSELWAKCLRLREEGRAVPGYPAVQARQTPVRSSLGQIAARQADGNGDRSRHRNQPSPLQTVVGGPNWEADSLRPLYHKYLEALREHGKETEDVSFANFSRQIVRKADAVKNRSSCDAVRLRLTIEEGRVLFKARPLRRRKKTS